jgi:GNAT superfamily N-acetyltransferase
MAAFTIRPATNNDARFLSDMLVEANNWHATKRRPRVQLLAAPEVAHYISGWPRPSDAGVVAVDTHGTPIGASWYRLFSMDDPGYGYVAAGVPELTLGVNPVWRAQGVGRALLKAVIARARAAGYARISLSVERANFAQRLYVSEGFVTVESGADSDTMVRALQ